MHHKRPEPVVMPSPHSLAHPQYASADEKASLLNRYCGPGQTDCPVLSDDYAMEVGLAGALQ